MKANRYSKSIPIIFLTAVLAACSSGGGDNVPPPNNPPPTGGIDRTGFAFGAIDGFGSVIVNGTRWDTATADITIDGVVANQAQLAVGDVVAIVGTLAADGAATAKTIAADDVLEGLVTRVDAAAGTLIVLGQTVIVEANTSFDDSISPGSLLGIAAGDFVEIAGFLAGDGTIVATRIERKANAVEYELNGVVSALDTAAMTFQIGAQLVDYSQATLNDFNNGMIADGDLVEVKGLAVGANDQLIPATVERKTAAGFDSDDGDEIEIEGFVTNFVDSTNFAVNGITVTTTTGTEYERGTAADLADGVRIEVEGSFDANGVLVARKVEFENSSNIRITAAIDNIDAANNSLIVLGITVTTDLSTRFEDKSDAGLATFSLADLAVGDYVEIRGSLDPDNAARVVASRLEREDLDNEVELRGPVEAIAEPAFTILGVTIETGSGTEFEGINDAPLSATEFFGQLVVGALVEADGVESSSTVIVADEVEFEDDD